MPKRSTQLPVGCFAPANLPPCSKRRTDLFPWIRTPFTSFLFLRCRCAFWRRLSFPTHPTSYPFINTNMIFYPSCLLFYSYLTLRVRVRGAGRPVAVADVFLYLYPRTRTYTIRDDSKKKGTFVFLEVVRRT